jgi:hypothetical protein
MHDASVIRMLRRENRSARPTKAVRLQKKADDIAAAFRDKGVPDREAWRRAWATVDRDQAGGSRRARPSRRRRSRP